MSTYRTDPPGSPKRLPPAPEGLRPDILAVALDSDYRRMAAEYLAAFQTVAPPEVVAYNVWAHGLHEAAEAGRWGHVANKLFGLVESAEEYYANP